MATAVQIAERLIGTVARAFYPDKVIAALDILLHEKYIVAEEFAARMQLRNKEMQEILSILMSNYLIKYEMVSVPGAKDGKFDSIKCYYVDYQSAINVIRYRIHTLMKLLKDEDDKLRTEDEFQCPSFPEHIYPVTQLFNMRCKDNQLACPNCAPENFKDVISADWYRLKQVDTKGQKLKVQAMKAKVASQLNKADGLHDGISDLLRALQGHPLPRNRPSENISKGITSSVIKDEDILTRVTAANREAAEKKLIGGSHIHKSADGHSQAPSSRLAAAVSKASKADTEGDDLGRFARQQAIRQEIYEQRDQSIPVFLQESGVYNSKAVLRSAEEMRLQRLSTSEPALSAAADASSYSQSNEDLPKKKVKTEGHMENLTWEQEQLLGFGSASHVSASGASLRSLHTSLEGIKKEEGQIENKNKKEEAGDNGDDDEDDDFETEDFGGISWES